MSCKIRPIKKSRLYEDGEQNNQTQQNNTQTQTADNTQNQQQSQSQNQNTAPAQQPAQNNNTQTAQNQNNTQQGNQNQQQSNNQQNNQPQQQEDPKVAEKRQKVTNTINGIREVIQQNNPYALIAFDLPKYIETNVPGFANDSDAKDTMTKWEAFKKNPSEQTFNDMMNSFATFGNGGQPVQTTQNNTNNTQQTQNQNNGTQDNNAQNNGTNESLDPVKLQQSTEYNSRTLGERINQRLEEELRIRQTVKQISDYSNLTIY